MCGYLPGLIADQLEIPDSFRIYHHRPFYRDIAYTKGTRRKAGVKMCLYKFEQSACSRERIVSAD